MDAGTPQQQARNCGLEQRGSPDLKQRVSLALEQRLSPDLKQRVSLDLEQRVSPCPSPPKIFPEFLPSAGSRWILIPPRGMGCLPPYERAGSNPRCRRAPPLKWEWVSSRPRKVQEATLCLNWEHRAPRVATLEDKLLQTIQRRQMTAAGFQRALEAAREQLLHVATTGVPKGNDAQNLAKRSGQHGEASFRFLTPPPHRPDEPSGRTGDGFRGDRPAHHPTDAQ